MTFNRYTMPLLSLLATMFVLTLAGPVIAKDEDEAAGEAAYAGDPFYLAECPVKGIKLGDEPEVLIYEGRELRFCCTGCVAKFEADPQKYISEIDAKMIADQLPYYALTTCPVTDEPLDSMGGPVDIIHNNRLVRFCCAGCIDEFKSNPETYIKKLDDAAKDKQAAGYPLMTCIVLPDEQYEEEHYYITVAGRVFRLCCGGCEAEVRSKPAEWIAKLEAAWASN
ncbi:MAG: YHS domain-containing protein [bacterium]|nr:YHS domain-containing protein [bacterium]